jgi:hypothetical protein
VLDLHIDVFWVGEKAASALLLRVIALSRLYSCIDNALVEVRDIGPAGVDVLLGVGVILTYLNHARVSDRGLILFIIVYFLFFSCT